MTADTEAAIFSRVIDPQNPTFSAEAARGFLQLQFTEADQERIAELAEKCNEGALSPDERREYEGFVFVGEMLALLQSKARLFLKRTGAGA